MTHPLDNDAQVRHVLETSSTFIQAEKKLGLSHGTAYKFLTEFQKKHNIKMLPLEVPVSDRVVYRIEDLPEELAEAIANAEIGK